MSCHAPSARAALAVALIAIAPAAAAAQRPSPVQYPATRTIEHLDDYHGTRIADPYRWLEDLNAPATAEWVTSQNALTNAHLAALPGRDAIKQRITALYDYARTSAPSYEGRHWFYSRNSGLQRQSPIFVRRSLTGAERVAIDPNVLSPDGTVSLSGFVPSPDGRHFAYGLSEGGSDWSTFYVRELATGKQTADTIRWVKFSGLSWTNDGRGFFYGRYPEPEAGKQMQNALADKKIYYHRLGTPQSQDLLIYDRPEEPALFISASLDETGRYLWLVTNKGTSSKNELLVKDLGDPARPNLAAPVRPLFMGHDAAYSPLGVVNGTIYLSTDRDAPTRKIVSASVAGPAAESWRTVVPATKNPIEGVSMVAGRIAVRYLEDVATAIRFYSLAGEAQGDLALPGLGSASGVSGRFDRPEMFYTFTSPLYPPTVFRYDIAAKKSTAWEPPKLTFDPAKYETKRVFYPSKDGTRIPMFITHRKGMALDGTNPTMLYAYGGFNASTTPTFRADVPVWLDMGGVWATASLRGGGEYGEAWHEAGMREKKQNVFDDFIAAGEYLVREKYTSPAKLGISGGSNGGLLVGVAMQQRPDLFGVALPAVGVMDMLRYHKFTGGNAWATEYGSADDPEAFEYLRAYSPLHNVKPGVCYPATLVTTADHDDRVVPSHSFKFAAAMQAAQGQAAGCTNPVLIRIETGGSHGYRPTDKRIAEQADVWAFAAQALGAKPPTSGTMQ
jgi:prolyl oligopeptidase